jgi:hypothetical protein
VLPAHARAYTALSTIIPGHRGYSSKIEVLVKAEYDFYREKWQKEKEQN